MEMKTAGHSTYFGPGRIVISLGNPRGVAGGYRMFKKLAPTREIMHLPYDEYLPRFLAEILAPLDPQAVWDELHALHPGVEPVIQCFERPPFTKENFCHRRIVSAWLEQHLGHVVDEMEPQTRPAKVAAPALI
jgi:hypothetical protein